jgi:hypothetical protein
MRTMRLWTVEDTAEARRLVFADAPNVVCIESLGRSRSACRARIRYVDNEDVRIKMSSRGRNRAPNKSKSRGINHIAEKPRGVPDDVIADAERRACAARSLTAWVFGDPAPGFSALDRKGAAA